VKIGKIENSFLVFFFSILRDSICQYRVNVNAPIIMPMYDRRAKIFREMMPFIMFSKSERFDKPDIRWSKV
jgi:hypothetical protein